MTYIYWGFAAFYAWATFLTIQSVGKPRPPLSPTLAAWATLLNTVVVILLARAALDGGAA